MVRTGQKVVNLYLTEFVPSDSWISCSCSSQSGLWLVGPDWTWSSELCIFPATALWGSYLGLSWVEWWCRTIAGEFWVNMSPVIVAAVVTHTCKLITQASSTLYSLQSCTRTISLYTGPGQPWSGHNIIIINQHTSLSSLLSSLSLNTPRLDMRERQTVVRGRREGVELGWLPHHTQVRGV